MNDMKMKLILEAADKNMSSTLKNADERAGLLNTTVGRVSSGMKLFGGVVAGLTLGKLASDFMEVNTEFDRLEASLETVTGSRDAAKSAFDVIQNFATTTPYQLAEVTDAFIRMKSLGLDANTEALRSYGNTASAMGKSLNQMIEAVADAATGEFERLKDFGIKARQQGDTVSLTFRGMTTTITNDAKSIEAYLQRIGNVDFAGGMERQMDTLGGKLSNLQDSWELFVRAVGESGALEGTVAIIGRLTGSVTALGSAVRLFKEMRQGDVGFWEWVFANPEDAQKLLKNVDDGTAKLTQLEERVRSLKKEKSGNFWWTAQEESELQQATKALEYYKLELGDVARLKNAADHIASPVEDSSASGGGKNSWTEKELKAFAEAGKGITDSWELTFRDRYEIQARSIQAEIDLENQRAEDTKTIWGDLQDSWLARDQGDSDYQTTLTSRLEALQQALLTEQQLVEQTAAERLQTLEEANAEELIGEQEYTEMRKQIAQEREDELERITQQGAERQAAVRSAVMNTALSMASMQLGQMASMMDQGNKKQFQAYKALAIVQAGISTVQAVMNALSVPPYPVGLALSITAGALGAAQIAKLSSMEYQGGKAAGGWVLPGRSVLVGEEGPEVITVGSDGGVVTPNHKLGGPSTSNQVSVTNVYQISPGVAGTVRAELLRMMPQIGAYSVQSVVAAINEGGDMARAVGRRS